MAVEVVSRHGGLVNQAVDEEIVSLFGVPAAHEDDERRAVRAALELHARVRESRWPRDGGSHPDPVRAARGPVVAQRLKRRPAAVRHRRHAGRVASRLASLPLPMVVVSPHCHRLVARSSAPASARGGPRGRGRRRSPRSASPARPGSRPGRGVGTAGIHALRRSGVELALLEAHVGSGAWWPRPRDHRRRRGRRWQEPAALRAPGAPPSAPSVRILQARCRAYGGVAPYFPFIEVLRAALDVRALSRRLERDRRPHAHD